MCSLLSSHYVMRAIDMLFNKRPLTYLLTSTSPFRQRTFAQNIENTFIEWQKSRTIRISA